MPRNDFPESLNYPGLEFTVIATDLFVPWEMRWGPDNHIWFTQRNGTVSRLDPETGVVEDLLHLNDVYEWTSSGMLGLALHPDFEHYPYVYIVYNYSTDKQTTGITERCVRYTYDAAKGKLTGRKIILDQIACGGGGTFGSRLLITPDNKLLMSTGCSWKNDQLTEVPGGVILRMNLDGSVPSDNPYPGNLMVASGFRNPQGLTMGRSGRIYISDHGPSTDDEIDILTMKGNYGWPEVKGYCDYDYECNYCDSVAVIEPVWAWTPTIAPGSLEYYDNDLIPEFKNCLLLATLKERDVRLLKLNDTGSAITEESTVFDNTFGRIRDICIAPNGNIYFSTANFDRFNFELNMSPDSTDYDKIVMISPK